MNYAKKLLNAVIISTFFSSVFFTATGYAETTTEKNSSSPTGAVNTASTANAAEDTSSLNIASLFIPGTTLTGNFDITSNYIFRGVSQTSNDPAVQGGLTYTITQFGLYANLWGSNVDFPDVNGNTATLELDPTLGITNTIDKFTYNLFLIRYDYPGATGVSYNELNAIGQFYMVTAQVAYSNNVFDTGDSGTYYNVGLNYNIPPRILGGLNGVNLSGGVGHYTLPQTIGSYNDYKIQLAKTIKNYQLSLAWTDTNIDPSSGLADNKLIFTVLVNF